MSNRKITLTMRETALIEAAMVLEEAIDEAQRNLAWYRRQGESGSVAAACTRERLQRAREARNTLEAARLKGRDPLWPTAPAEKQGERKGAGDFAGRWKPKPPDFAA